MAQRREAWLIYDGDCPFCRAYVRSLRLPEGAVTLHRVNAREGGSVVRDVVRQGCHLDEGLVLKIDGALYQGEDAIHRLALLSTRSGGIDRLATMIFANRRVSRLLYPGLRSVRNLTLRVLGRRPLRLPPDDGA